MRRLIEIIDRFWFSEAPAERLAILRFTVGGYALYYVGARYDMFMQIAVTDSSLFAPVGVAAFLEQPISLLLFKAIVISTIALNILFLLGWKHRYTGPAFSLLLLFLLCYRNSWQMVYHSQNILALHAIILGFTRAADRLSLDAFFKSRSLGKIEDDRSNGQINKSNFSWQYGWPIMLICAVTVSTYFLAGMAKIEATGFWTWAEGEALRSQVATDGLRKELLGSSASPLIYFLFDHSFLFAVFGIATFIIELGAPIALLNRRLGRIWAVGALMMHLGIFFIMGINFPYHLSGLAFASFFNLERLIPWVRHRSEKWKLREGESV